jgi:hypothetical protein
VDDYLAQQTVWLVRLVQYVGMYTIFHTANNEGPEVAAIEGSGETKGPESMLTGRSRLKPKRRCLNAKDRSPAPHLHMQTHAERRIKRCTCCFFMSTILDYWVLRVVEGNLGRYITSCNTYFSLGNNGAAIRSLCPVATALRGSK